MKIDTRRLGKYLERSPEHEILDNELYTFSDI